MQVFKKTALHTIELAVIILAAFAFLRFFNLDSETSMAVVTIAVSALAKYARTSPAVPLNDYVNK